MQCQDAGRREICLTEYVVTIKRMLDKNELNSEEASFDWVLRKEGLESLAEKM